MAENLQYTVTFKTRSEGTGAQDTARAVRDLAAEQARYNQLSEPEKIGAKTAGFVNLDAAVTRTATSTRKLTQAAVADDAQRATAIQTIRRIRQEIEAEAEAKRKSAIAAGIAGTATKGFGAHIQNASFQVQDMAVQMASGTSAATALGQQLPQLLGGLGPFGAAAGGVLAIGALVLKLASATEGSEEAAKAAEELKNQLNELQDTKAQEFAEAYADAIRLAAAATQALRDDELARVETGQRIAAINREIEATIDATTLATLDYIEATTGADTSAQRAALRERERLREAEKGNASATAELEKQQKAYEGINAAIAEAKQQLVDFENERQALDQTASDLAKQMNLASIQGKQGEVGDIELELKRIEAISAQVDGMIRETTQKIGALGQQAEEKAMEIDRVRAVAEAEMQAVNARLEQSAAQDAFNAVIEQNKALTGNLTAALDDYQAQTPVQQQAAAQIRAALADGKLTAEEIATTTGSLQVLLATSNSQQSQNNSFLLNVISLMQKFDGDLRKANAQIEALKSSRPR